LISASKYNKCKFIQLAKFEHEFNFEAFIVEDAGVENSPSSTPGATIFNCRTTV